MHVLILESVRDFYNFRVNHAQFYVNGNTVIVCKNEEDPFKIESTRVVTTFLQLKVYGDFSKRSRAGSS